MRNSVACHLVWAATIAIIGCSDLPDGPPPLSDADRTALQRFADEDCRIVMSADWDALASEYVEDAVRMPPGGPSIVGRTAIRNSLDQVPPITQCTFDVEQVGGTAYVAFMRASYDMTIAPPDAEPIRDTGKILIVFEKQADGSWMRVVDAWNAGAAIL